MNSAQKQAAGWQQYLTQYLGWAPEDAKRASWGIVRVDREGRGLPAVEPS